MNNFSFFKQTIIMAVLASLLVSAAGCRTLSSRGGTQLRIIPFVSQNTAALSARQVVEVGLQAGLSSDQVLSHGTAIRNALAGHGGCRIHQNQRVRMIMAVREERLYVSTHTGATFIYDLNERDND